MSETNTKATTVQAMTVDDAKNELPSMDRAQLVELRAMEAAEGDGKTRVTLIRAIDERLAELPVAADGEADDGAGGSEEATNEETREADASNASDDSDDEIDAMVETAQEIDPDELDHMKAELEANSGAVARLEALSDRLDAMLGNVGHELSLEQRFDIMQDVLASLHQDVASRDAKIASLERADAERQQNARAGDPAAGPVKAEPREAVKIALREATTIAFDEHPDALGKIDAFPDQFEARGYQAVWHRPLKLKADLPPFTITEARLIDAEGDLIGVCALASPMRAGGGVEVQFGSGSFAFADAA